MLKQFWSILIVALVFYTSVDHVDCETLKDVSWIFRGAPQTNNTALTFNLYDTLNLICRASVDQTYSKIFFAISKGSIPTGMAYATGILTVNNVGTLIYSDVDGLQYGYENFVVYASPYFSNTGTSYMITTRIYEYRFVNVGLLKTTDAATYHCSAAYPGTSSVTFKTSGGLTVVVNTKDGQAHSSRSSVNRLLTYSTAILGASKLVF